MDFSTGQESLAEDKTEGVETDKEDKRNVQLPGQTEDNDSIGQDEVDINTEEGTDHIAPKTHRIELNEPQSLSETDEGTCNDEVVPFVLDEDFDYDNVVLTPKFTIQHLNVLTD